MTVYQATNEFLIEKFTDSNCVCEFSKKATAELIQRIARDCKKQNIDNPETKEQIRKSIHDFFVECGRVVVFFKKTEKIIVKIIPYEIDPKEGLYVEEISTYLESVAKEIKKDSNDENIIKISQNYLFELEKILHNISLSIDTRRVIRFALSSVFGLSRKDLILFINNTIIIRRSCERGVCEKRFEGLPADEIKKLFDSIYPEKEDMQIDMEIIVSYLADTALNFSKIDNRFFEENNIKIIQKAIIDFIKKKLPYPNIVVIAVSNYIFRNSFSFVHRVFAEKLLELLANKNKNAEKFIRYYKGDISIEDGKRFMTHEIIDCEGQKWNASTIINFIMQYKKDKNDIKEKTDTIRQFQSENIKITERLTLLNEDTKKIQEKLNNAFLNSKQAEEELDKKRTYLQEVRRVELESGGKSEENSHKLEREAKILFAKFQEEQRDAQELKVKYMAMQKEIKTLEKRDDFLKKQIEHESKNVISLQERFEKQIKRYDTLLDAISQVLIKKRQMI
ncbi:MAG: hypothetical protein QG567_966 [Campylobacterota bacterium]|nr:hypothetical protein [Campylobacterota bacterium]